MRDNQSGENDFKIRSGCDVSLLYVDLQRVQDRNTLRDRQLTAVSLGLSASSNGTAITVANEAARSVSAVIERRLSTLSHSDSVDEFEGGEEKVVKPTPVRYQRLDDRLRFANTLVAANPADIIVIDGWPEECLMRSSFPAFDEQDEEDSYVTKTAFRPNGGRGAMIAVKRRCLLPEDDKHITNVGLISLERLVKRNWTPYAISQGGYNQAWLSAVDAGPAIVNPNKLPVRLAIVVYDCGRGYPFQNGLNEAASTKLAKTPPSLFTSRLFLNCRFPNISSNLGNMSPRITSTQAVRSVVGNYETKTTLLKAARSNSSLGTTYQNGHGKNNEPSHTWWRGSTTMPNNGNGANCNTVVEGITSQSTTGTPKLVRKKSWIETRAATPMEEAEERIRIAGELKQLKSFMVVTLANQIGDRRHHIERRASEQSLDKFNTLQNSNKVNGAVALVVGRFGINSLPLAQSLASCANTPLTNQECQVTVCDNDRCETLTALWWRPKNRPKNGNGFFSLNNNNNHDRSPSNSIDETDETSNKNGNEQISINDTTATLEYDRNEWLEAEFECRPRMFSLTFH